MSDLSARLDQLSPQERAALFNLLRKRKGEAAAEAPAPPLPRGERREAPLSFAQQRLWFLDRLAPGSPLYNVPGALRCTGRLDPAVLAGCFSEVLRRHAALRTRFEIRGDAPVQIVEAAAPVPLPLIDLSALPEAVRLPEEQRIVRAENLAPFDLSRPPLLRVHLLRLGAAEHLLVYVFHHIASDAWSLDVAVHEVATLYPALLAGQPSPLPELPLQYADFAWEQTQALQGEALAREIGYWRPRLAGAPVLELPIDHPRPAMPSLRGAELEEILPQVLDAGLRELAREQRVTPFMALLAAVGALLARLAGTEDVVVGTLVTGRDRWNLKDLIGFFVNTLVLRLDCAADPDCRALLAQSRQVVLGAFAHQALPFEKLVDELGLPRDPYRPPLLRVLFQLFPSRGQSASLPGLELERYQLPAEMAKFDLVINVLDLQDGLVFQWHHDKDLFEAETIVRWAGAFRVLLSAWLRDPSLRLSELPLLTQEERHQILTAWNPRSAPGDRGRRLLPALFEAQVDRTPDAPAVSGGEEAGALLTYRELDARANRLARWLVDAGVVSGDRVALRLDRSPEMIVSLLGVLKTGAAYVPLDPSFPAERLTFALEDSGATLLLDMPLLAREAEAIARRSGARLGLDLDPELPAYVIYTSGSTGRPKGVIVPHGAVTRLFSATDAWFGFSPADVWTLFHSYAFDFSVWEIWGALLYGGRLVVVPWAVSRDPEAFVGLLHREGVTVLNQTPSAFRLLVSSPAPPSLRLVLFGGEALDPTMLEPWFARHDDEHPRLANLYGITETTVHVTYRPLSRADAARPASLVGRPIPDLTARVLDRRLELQPLGIPGEICVGGEGLAHGYLGRPDLTAERFVPDPFGNFGARLYRSGDLARRRPDGDLEYLGRIDHQVKIRGFRIELGEIEAALTALPGVREAAVLARADGAGGEHRLVGYVTVEEGAAPTLTAMRDALGRRLPEYMVPSALVVLDRFPLTANGKLDRRALPSPEAGAAPEDGLEHVPPRDALESWVAGLFRQVLSVPEGRAIGALDDFFALGGTSISGAILINRLQGTLGEIVHVVAIFDHPTVEALAAYVREEHPAAAARLWNVAAPAVEDAAAPAGPLELAEMRRLISAGRPEPETRTAPEPVNPPAVFLLSPPRSGSTLLRVMLGAHPRLFAPPELELLSFQTLAGRQEAFQGRDSFWLEGVTRAVMEARGCDAAGAERILAAATAEGWSTRRFYRELQGWIGDRLLVDKTPSYALDPAVLGRGEAWFSGARYLHLVRHPQATNRSFEEARLDQIFFRRPHRFPRRQLAELIWTVSHRNILDFLAEIPAERRHAVRFEELVRDPEGVLAGVCGFLGIDFDPTMVDPYRGGTARMADGLRAESRMLGDVKFHTHGKVDAAAAERWRDAGAAPLGAPAQALAAELGYAGVDGQRSWEEGGTAPASFAQERLWLLDQLLPGTSTYNIPGAIRLAGSLDVTALARAIDEIVRRHAALRTVFTAVAGQPAQKVEPWRSRPLPRADLAALPAAARDTEVRRLAAEEARRPFDLTRGPLFRVALLRLGPAEHVALFTMHHVVSDGWSMGVFYREVAALYEAFAAGRPSPLSALPLQYPDFAIRQRGRLGEERMTRDLAWWKERLAGLEPVELPTDRPRPAVRSGRGAATALLYGPDLGPGLTALGLRERATLYMVLLAGFRTLLHRITRQEDIAVGSPVANRTEGDVEGLIGFFVNTLVLRTGAGGDPTFREMLARVRRTVLDAFLHQEAPFERVVEVAQPERQLAVTPLFQVMFSLQNAGADSVALPGLSMEWVSAPTVTAKFDLSAAFSESPGGLGARLELDLDLYDRATGERLLRDLGTLLAGALAAPDARLSALPLLAPAEREQTLAAWNRTTADFPRHRPIHRLVEERVDLQPDAVAVSADGTPDLTYAELDAAASRLAHHLRRLGAGPEVPVLVVLERSPELIVAGLAVQKSGSFFVPFDPAHPRERLTVIAERVGARLAVTREASLDLLPAGVEAVCVDRDRDAIAAEPAARPETGVLAENLMYVLFTSGSTGEPKGVAVRHRNAGNLLHGNDFSQIGPGETYVVLTAATFDPSILEVWGTLVHGGRLAVLPPQLPGLDELADFLDRHGVTQMHLTTALFHQMAERRPERLAGLHRLAVGGEALSPALARRALEAVPGLLLTNCYGPTEITVICSTHDVAPEDGHRPAMPIGRPVANARLYVLDRWLNPLPLGVWGELYIGGEGVSRGYFGRPELTAERYGPDPFDGEVGARLYRSGDMVRWRPDGILDFAGRIDRQVKIRGYRIEPGEIEAALTAHPNVADAAVLVRGEGNQRWLVAYVASAEAAGEDLRRWLAGRLPDPMVPTDFVLLPSLPLTPNGKVDRGALARISPERAAAEDGALPRTPTEERLAELWVDVLGAERTGGRVGARDHFFGLGGHSLLATRLMAAIRDVFAVELPLRVVFEQPTLEEMARAVDAHLAGPALDRVPRAARRSGEVNRFPVSFAQLREWILDRLEPGNPAYNIASNLRIGGPLSIPVLATALQGLVRRHEVFRTAFVAGPDEGQPEPLQEVIPDVRLEIPVIDLSALPEAEREAELWRRVRHQAGTGFDLAVAPLLRARIVRLGATDHALLMTVHHIVSDGWSMGILNQELAALYEAAATGAPSPLPELPVQYGDYAAWQRRRLDGAALEEQTGFWRRRLAGAPPLLELPTDRPRPPVRSSRGGKVPFQLPKELSARLEELALGRGATLFMVLLAGYQALLARWSGQDDIVVGTYSGNRPRKELEGLIGFFINTLVLRTDLSGDPSFAGLIGRVRETTLEVFAHRDVPFEKLLETLQLPRDPSRTPLFQALLVLQNFPPTKADLSTGVRLSSMPVGGEKSDYDLALWLGEGPDGISGVLEHSTDLFDCDTMLRFAAQLRTLLESAVAEPDRDIWTLPLLGAEEQRRQLAAWSHGPEVPEGALLLHRLVEEQAGWTPDAVAVEAGGVRITYAELVDRARGLAGCFRETGVGPGSIVALAAERTPELVVNMLAVLQTGAAYLPVDPAYPAERREWMVVDAGAVEIEDGKDFKDGNDEEQSLESLKSLPLSPETPAYLIYTSGSTGRPKGVVIPHRAIASFVRAARESYGINPGDRVLQFASISFDTSAEEIWPALASGATLVLRPEDMASSIPHFLRELERLGITHLDLPTAFWHELVAGMEAENLELPPALRLVILGGEEALADRFALWHRRAGPAVRLVNTYGPTETTIVATRRDLTDLAPGGMVPIGRPIAGACAYVLDRFLAPVSSGVRGELWIGGAGVAQGYLGRPDLTADRFRPDPFGNPGDRLYRTGDLAVLRPDGDLVFAGRADRQLKVRGYRIEPAEIEAALRLHPGVHDAVVDVRGPRDGQRLIAWIVPRAGSEAPGAAELRAFLRGSLPEPLLPAAFASLPALPLTPSGKLDRRALAEPTEAHPGDAAWAEPQSALERTIAGIYGGLLRVRRVGLHDNFFDLGGHSLLIVRAHQRLKDALGREIPVVDLFRFPTVATLARHLGGEETGGLRKVQGLAEQQRNAQQRQRAAMERLRRPAGPVRR